MISIVLNGYILNFNEELGPSKLSKSPIPFSMPSSTESVDALSLEVKQLLANGVVEAVNDQSSARFYSRLFLVPKKVGGSSPVIEFSMLHKNLESLSFKMETTPSIMAALRQGEWTISIDLRDA